MARVLTPIRGEVYWVALDPVVGIEIAMTRPSLVISNEMQNRFSPRVIIAAVTTGNVDRIYPFEALIPVSEGGLVQTSQVLLSQIRSVDKQRLGGFLGSLSAERMQEVDAAIRISLSA